MCTETLAAYTWPGFQTSGTSGQNVTDFLRELEVAAPGAYAPSQGIQRGSLVSPPLGGDWIVEVLQNLSGIQRKSRGRAQVSQWIFHQTSEFVALYAGRPKSTVHLVVAPKRLVRRRDAGASEASLAERLGIYADYLARSLAMTGSVEGRPSGLLFAAGLRVREGSAQQLHAHLVSMDLVPACIENLERRHFEDFAGGTKRFMSLSAVVQSLRSAGGLPQIIASQPGLGRELACHRCGQRFADAIRQLVLHCGRCTEWPGPEAVGKHKPSASDEDRIQMDLDHLEEMGFGSAGGTNGCDRYLLREALMASGGSLERAVEVLAAA